MIRFLRFWYDFIIGDDWCIAAGVAIAVALSALLAVVAFVVVSAFGLVAYVRRAQQQPEVVTS